MLSFSLNGMAGFPVKLLMADCRAHKALPRFHKIHHPSQHIWMRFVLFVSLWPFLENFTSLKGPSLASRGQAMGGQCLISSFARRSVSLKTRIGGTRSPVNLLRSYSWAYLILAGCGSRRTPCFPRESERLIAPSPRKPILRKTRGRLSKPLPPSTVSSCPPPSVFCR